VSSRDWCLSIVVARVSSGVLSLTQTPSVQLCSNSSWKAGPGQMNPGLRPTSCSMHQSAACMHQSPRVTVHAAAAPAHSPGRLQSAYPAARPDALGLQRALSRQRQAQTISSKSTRLYTLAHATVTANTLTTRHQALAVLHPTMCNCTIGPVACCCVRAMSHYCRSSCLGGASVQLSSQQQQARQTPERLRCAASASEVGAD
jgi:hypothetical protein